MVVCYSHCLLPLCQLTLTSPLARGDILSCSASGCLCAVFSFRFACRFRQASPSQLAVKGRGTTKWWKGCTSAREPNSIVLCPVK